MGVYTYVASLVQYGLDTGLITHSDSTYITNQLLEALRLDSYEPAEPGCLSLEEILKGLLDDAVSRGVIGDDITSRDLLDTKLMGITMLPQGEAYHINQRNEGINLHGVSGALMATHNMQMQTFVTQPESIGFDGYNGDLTGEVSATLGTNCGMSTGRNGVINFTAFAANRRDEVRDLHNIAGALGAQSGMKQQTFITEEQLILCLNDQGGQVMNISVNITGTLRAQMHSHQPLLLESNQNHATVRDDGVSTTLPASMGMGGGYVPMVYENHGIDSRYTRPHEVVPTISARCGTGGNNVPLVGSERSVFSRQRVDVFRENNVVSTESARQ